MATRGATRLVACLLVLVGVLHAGAQPVPPPERPSATVSSADAGRPVRVGVLTDNYPYSFTDDNGDVVGFVVDLTNAVEEAMGLRFERVYGSTRDINGAFERGDLDMLQSYADSPAREVYTDFSVPYLSMAGSIFVRRDLSSAITRLEDLKGHRVLVHAGSVGEQILQANGLGDTVEHVPSVNHAFLAIEDGRGDATLAARLTGLMAVDLAGLRNVVAAGEPVPGYSVRYCFAVRDGNRQLLARLNEGLAIIERTGQARDIYDRWFSRVEPRRYSPFVIVLSVATGLAFALAVAVWGMLRQRALAEKLRQQEAQMHRAQKLEAIGTLSSGIAHDFNNILTTIIGNAELLQADFPEGSHAADAAADILAAAERAQRLVAQILTFSRRTEVKHEVTALTPIVEEAVRFLRATTPTTISIRHRAEGAPMHVNVDATQLHQALMNIGTNAVHAMRGGTGTIDIVERRIALDATAAARAHVPPGDYASVTVRDSGSGIPPDVLPRIFDPFFTTKKQGEGTGLGLAVVLGVVQAHGGGITVWSALGAGTEVRLYLPLAAQAVDVAPTQPSARPAGHGQRILLIDDEEAIVRSVSLALRRIGYLVTGHTDPTEAVEEFEARPDTIDIVVTDLTMPYMTGLDITRRLRRLRPDLPVILVSGFMGEGDLDTARVLGVNAVIDKPLTLDTLAAALDRCLAAAVSARRDTQPRVQHSTTGTG